MQCFREMLVDVLEEFDTFYDLDKSFWKSRYMLLVSFCDTFSKQEKYYTNDI